MKTLTYLITETFQVKRRKQRKPIRKKWNGETIIVPRRRHKKKIWLTVREYNLLNILDRYHKPQGTIDRHNKDENFELWLHNVETEPEIIPINATDISGLMGYVFDIKTDNFKRIIRIKQKPFIAIDNIENDCRIIYPTPKIDRINAV